MEQVEGVLEDVSSKKTSKGEDMFVYVVAGKKYSSLNKVLGEQFLDKKGSRVKISYVDKVVVGVTYHNVFDVVLLEEFRAASDLPKEAASEVWERKDRRSMRAMCVSYAKDCFVAGKILQKDILPAAESFFGWVWGG